MLLEVLTQREFTVTVTGTTLSIIVFESSEAGKHEIQLKGVYIETPNRPVQSITVNIELIKAKQFESNLAE